MALDYTSTAVIADLKRRGKIPTNQNLYQETDLAAILSAEINDTILPRIMSVREDHFVTFKDTLIVTGTDSYAIPQRAVGGKLKDVVIVDNLGTVLEDLPRLTYTDVSLFSPMDYVKLYGFYLQGDDVRLYPNASGWNGRYLRQYYFRRPNKLVVTTAAGKITAINTGTLEVTLDNAPSTWTAATTFDVIAGRPNFRSVVDDAVITNIAGSVLTFTSVTGFTVGDYVAEAGESPVPQIPYDAFGWLAQRGALKAVESIANQQELAAHIAAATDQEARFIDKITPRVDDAPKKIVSRKGIFRASRRLTWPR